MDLIKYLLQNVFKLVIILFIAAFVLWLGKLFYPQANISSYASSTGIGYFFSGDWLPAPRAGGLAGTTTPIGGFTYKPGPAYNGWASSTQPTYPGQYGNVNDQVWNGDTSAYRERSLYVRNISLYDNGVVSYGQTIYGEARQEMFKNGVFTIAIIDRSGRVLSAANAINTGTFSAPGWAHFQVTIQNRLPNGTECALVFYSANQQLKVGMPVTCR
jgi:hypothetical protein